MTDKNPWAEVIGPCYTRASLARALGWAEEEVTTAATSLTILELLTEDGVLLYPALQVWDGRVVPGLTEVLQTLRSGTTSRWTWAQWLNTRPDDGDGGEELSAIERLRAGGLEDVLLDARHDARVWGQ